MSENSRPPVAIRIVRPYQTEDEFLTSELETVGKTSIILIGAHPRPPGVILRFEVTLASGTTVLRGEGRVLAHKERAFRGQPGLSLRFTRLDPKSKAVIDRAAAMRDARLSGDVPSLRPPMQTEPQAGAEQSAPPPPAAAHEPVAIPISFPAPADPALEAALTAPTPDPPPHIPFEETPTPPPFAQSMAESMAPIREPEPSSPVIVEPISEREPPPPTPASPRAGAVNAPANREEMLARLRERAATLSRERVDAILTARKS